MHKEDDNMSMEDILASIRRYVSTSQDDNKVVRLTEDMVEKKSPVLEDAKAKKSPFVRLAEVSKPSVPKCMSTKDITILELVEKITQQVIEEWADKNLERIAEQMIAEKINEMTSED